MSSWKGKKPIGNSQSSYIRQQRPVDEITLQQKIYNIDRRKQYKIASQIDNNLYNQTNITDLNSLINEYEKFFSKNIVSNKNEFFNKLKQLRYQSNLYSEQFDINLIDLLGRLLKFLSLFQSTAVEDFCDLFITTKIDDLVNTLVPFYLMNFNKKYYDYI